MLYRNLMGWGRSESVLGKSSGGLGGYSGELILHVQTDKQNQVGGVVQLWAVVACCYKMFDMPWRCFGPARVVLIAIENAKGGFAFVSL